MRADIAMWSSIGAFLVVCLAISVIGSWIASEWERSFKYSGIFFKVSMSLLFLTLGNVLFVAWYFN